MTILAASRLLLVDDEPEILAEVAAYLRRHKVLVTTASCFEEAHRILSDRSRPFDIVVTDVRMPDGSGVELCRAFMRRPGGGSWILMTGHLELTDLSPDLLEANLGIIYKPFSLSAFRTRVREVLAAKPARG